MRSYLRPLIVISSALALAALISLAAVTLTEPPAVKKILDLGRAKTPQEVFSAAKAAAAGGDPQALLTLAELFSMGAGTTKDKAEAARLHKLGADQGDAECEISYALDLQLGRGLKQDVDASLVWLRKAADQKNGKAEYHLSHAYKKGTGTPVDLKAAREWLILSAEHGFSEARLDLAEEIMAQEDWKRSKIIVSLAKPAALEGQGRACHIMSFVYAKGVGVKADQVESMAWRLLSLVAAHPPAGDNYHNEYEALSEEEQAAAEKRAAELSGKRPYRSPFARDPKEVAAEKIEFSTMKAKAEQGDLKAQYRMITLYGMGQGTKLDLTEAARWCRKAAERGHPGAQFYLGEMLRQGVGVSEDSREAFSWYLKSAQQGSAEAERALSLCFQNGYGVEMDLVQTKHWRRKAAEHGDPRAQCDMALDYYDRHTPDPANDVIAARWFRRAAEQLYPKGTLGLGLCYISGRGVELDKNEGLAWMLSCARSMNESQQEKVTLILQDFSEAEILIAQTRKDKIVEECSKKNAPSAASTGL